MIVKALIFFLFANSFYCNVDTSNKMACSIVERHLKVIKNYLDKRDIDSSGQRMNSISFLEELTNIQSESDGTFIGKLSPTKNDYNNWNSWYRENKSFLLFDDKNKRVYLKKKE